MGDTHIISQKVNNKFILATFQTVGILDRYLKEYGLVAYVIFVLNVYGIKQFR